MSSWVLDDGPFGRLARQFDAGWRWPPQTFHVVEQVAAAAKNDRTGRRTQLLEMPDSAVAVHAVMPSSNAGRFIFDYLRSSETSATKDLGEDASLALCVFELPDSIFVVEDKAAAFLALAELGPARVATPFDFFAHLRDEKLIDAGAFAALCESLVRAHHPALVGVPYRLRVPVPPS